jgi:hypothetical protein
MPTQLTNLAVLAAGSGRGHDPSGIGGAAIVVGIAVLVLVLALSAYFVISRYARTRSYIFRRRRPYRRGRIGRIT